jgi:large subunit ribosomal protein L13e
MVKHNNVIVNVHLRKHWERIGVKTHFNQPAQKVKRSAIRKAKEARMCPKPVNSLRPIVSQCTNKYAGKVRLGRGFTLVELKEAGMTQHQARTIGISVDHRRTSSNMEQLQQNVARLNAYKSKLVITPKRAGKPKKSFVNDATKEQLEKHTSQADQFKLTKAAPVVEYAKITEEDKKKKVYHSLREMRTNTRYKGRRDKKKDEAEKAKE